MHRARALSSKVNKNGQMAIAITLPGFNDLGRIYDPYFSFDDGSFSVPTFYVLPKKEENLSRRSLNFLQNAPLNSVHLTTSFS